MPTLLVLALMGAERPCAEDLCRFRLEQLKLVAIVSGDEEPVAMFEDPLGKGLIARKGSRIGKSGGRVTAIGGTCVTITGQSEKTELCL